MGLYLTPLYRFPVYQAPLQAFRVNAGVVFTGSQCTAGTQRLPRLPHSGLED